MEKQVLNAYLDTKTGNKFKIWETESQYSCRDGTRYKQISLKEV